MANAAKKESPKEASKSCQQFQYSYLNIRTTTASGLKFISCDLEEVVLLMEHPNQSFLADLETHLMVLTCRQNQAVVQICLSCIEAVAKKITKIYRLSCDCFAR